MISLRAILGTCLIFLIRATRVERSAFFFSFFRLIHRVFRRKRLFLHTFPSLSLAHAIIRCIIYALPAHRLKQIDENRERNMEYLTFSFFFVSLLSGEVAVFGVDASVGVVTSAVSAGDSPPDSCFVSFTSSCWNKRNLWMIEPCSLSLSTRAQFWY